MPAPELLIPEEPETGADAEASHASFLDRFAPRPKKSVVESLVRGGAQGASADFADEITGGLSAAFGNDYRQARDASRGEYKAAETDNPLAYKAGQLAGGLASIFLPGGAVTKGAGLAANVARGAAYGAAQATGASETEATEHPLELAQEAGQGAAGGAAAGALGHVALKGLAAILSPVGKVASRVAERAGTEADKYATERLVTAQAKGEAELGKEASKFAPLLEKEPANRQTAAASAEGASASATKKLTDSALDRLKLEAGNKQKIQVFGRRGANEGAIKDVLGGDRELRAAIDVGGEAGVSAGSARTPLGPGQGPSAALELVGKRLETEGDRLDKIYEAAQGLTPGVKPQAVLGGLREVEQEYRRLGATAPLADVVKKEMKRFATQYKGAKAIPLQEMREQYRAWQDLGFSGGAQFSVSAQKQIQRDMGNVMRKALQEEIESAGSETAKDLVGELRIVNKRVSALKGIETLLDEWATRKAAAAPTMGEMTLSPLRSIKNALEQQAVGVGRAALGHAAAAAARGGAGGAPSAAMARLMAAARSGALTTKAISEALEAGIPQDVIDKVKGMAGGTAGTGP